MVLGTCDTANPYSTATGNRALEKRELLLYWEKMLYFLWSGLQQIRTGSRITELYS
jgi:hypothetical protein